MRTFEFKGEFPHSRIAIGNYYLNIRDDVARSPATDFHVVGEVFLSSTFGDFRKYRDRVSNDLSKMLGLSCPTIESETIGWLDVVDTCKTRVFKSHIFLLLAGHWYGSIPPGYAKSITHMEFEWAQIPLHQSQQRPIAVYIPNPGSEADNELKDEAHKLISANYHSFTEHQALMEDFRNAYSSWRIVNRFDDLNNLSQSVTIFCALYKGASLANSIQGNVNIESKSTHIVSDALLGLLGRHKQLSALDDIFSNIKSSAGAIPIVIHGPKHAGQHEFMLQVIRTDWFRKQERRLDAKSVEQRPPKATYNGLSALIEWIATVLGVYGNRSPENVGELAERITKELATQQLTLILDHIESYGGTSQFYQEFWQPFYAELLRLRQIHQPKHRLVCFLVHYGLELAELGCTAYVEDFECTGELLISLPVLKDITRNDLQRWLKKYTLVPEEHHEKLIHIALEDPESKTENGTPAEVFDRLRGEEIPTDDDL